MLEIHGRICTATLGILCVLGFGAAQGQDVPPVIGTPVNPAGESAAPPILGASIEVRTYPVQEILERLGSESGMLGTRGEEWVEQRIRDLFPPVESAQERPVSSWTNIPTSSGTTRMSLDANGCGVSTQDGEVLVACPKAQQRAVARLLETWSQFGFRQVVIRTLVYRGDSQEMSQLPISWSHVEALSQVAETPESAVQTAVFRGDTSGGSAVASSYIAARGLQRHRDLVPPIGVTGDTWTQATSVVERSTPVLYTVLTPQENQQLQEKLRETTSAEKLMSPQVVVFNGQMATVSDSVQRPFVTGIKPMRVGSAEMQRVEFTPSIRVYPEGTMMDMLPELVDGDRVRLSYHLRLSKIRRVETLDLPRFDGPGKFRIQMPEVASTRFQTRLQVPLEHALAISSFDRDENGAKKTILVVCQCFVRDMERTEAAK